MTRGAAESEVYNLLEYSMPPEEAVCALYQSNNPLNLIFPIVIDIVSAGLWKEFVSHTPMGPFNNR